MFVDSGFKTFGAFYEDSHKAFTAHSFVQALKYRVICFMNPLSEGCQLWSELQGSLNASGPLYDAEIQVWTSRSAQVLGVFLRAPQASVLTDCASKVPLTHVAPLNTGPSGTTSALKPSLSWPLLMGWHNTEALTLSPWAQTPL